MVAPVMERFPVTASPFGGGRLGGWTACLGSSRPMSSAGYDFHKFGNRLLRESLSCNKPLVLS